MWLPQEEHQEPGQAQHAMRKRSPESEDARNGPRRPGGSRPSQGRVGTTGSAWQGGDARLVLRVIKGWVIASRRRRIKSEPGDKRHRGEGIERVLDGQDGGAHGRLPTRRRGQRRERAGVRRNEPGTRARRVVVEQGLEELRVRPRGAAS